MSAPRYSDPFAQHIRDTIVAHAAAVDAKRLECIGQPTAYPTIWLFIGEARPGDVVWLARHSDPSVAELFGTDTLPTPFDRATPAHVVRRVIEERNPGVSVRVCS